MRPSKQPFVFLWSASKFVVGSLRLGLDAPIVTLGNITYMAWPNNDKTLMISAPNKGHTVDLNTQVSASGSNDYVIWWTNKTGTLMPVFRASNDNGDTFAKAITLNSTG